MVVKGQSVASYSKVRGGVHFSKMFFLWQRLNRISTVFVFLYVDKPAISLADFYQQRMA